MWLNMGICYVIEKTNIDCIIKSKLNVWKDNAIVKKKINFSKSVQQEKAKHINSLTIVIFVAYNVTIFKALKL
jgi:hypothetical protein